MLDASRSNLANAVELRGPGGEVNLLLMALSKRFGGMTAVDNVDLNVRSGEFLTLLGPSGSGKTTLLMMIAGFVDPTAGDLQLDGQSILNVPPERRDFGMVFQGYALFPHMTVTGNIAYPLEVRRQSRSTIATRVAEMLELVQLEPFADRYPTQLSGGQQQRVALARALSFKPRLLLLDEPLGALDRKLRGEVQEQLKELHRKTGTTFIYVTHDQEEAMSMSDRIAILSRGRLVQFGTPSELYERPATIFVADFLGKSNFLNGRVVARHGGSLTIDVAGCALQQWAEETAHAAGDPVTLALRPERIALADARNEARAANRLAGRILHLTYLGSEIEIRVNAGAAGTFIVRGAAWRGGSRFAIGQSVWLDWPEDAAVIVAPE